VVLGGQGPQAVAFHVDGGSDGVIIDLRHGDGETGPQKRVLIAAFGGDDHPRRFVRQVPIIQRLGDLALDESGPVVVVAPAAWGRAAPRWRAVAAATGVMLPAKGMPATHPRWLPRPFATSASAIAARGLALRASARGIRGAPRRAVVVEVGPASDQSR